MQRKAASQTSSRVRTSAANRAPLSRARIISVAVDLVDHEGVQKLTMRRLAQLLGVEAMSIYSHVPSKRAVLDGLSEEISLRIECPQGATSWQENLVGVVRALRGFFLQHPHLLSVWRPSFGARRPPAVEYALSCMMQAGYSFHHAQRVFFLVASYGLGHTLFELRLAEEIGATPSMRTNESTIISFTPQESAPAVARYPC
jgi:AcrR family transcriptional regulator